MSESAREWRFPLLAAGALVAVLPAALIAALGHDQVDLTGFVHLICVGVTALVTAVAAILLTIAGARRADTRTVVVGGAFAVMAALLALHGLSTPGVLVGQRRASSR